MLRIIALTLGLILAGGCGSKKATQEGKTPDKVAKNVPPPEAPKNPIPAPEPEAAGSTGGHSDDPVYRTLESHRLEHLFDKLQQMGVRRVEDLERHWRIDRRNFRRIRHLCNFTHTEKCQRRYFSQATANVVSSFMRSL